MTAAETHQKAFVSIRYFLIGAKMYMALGALEFAASIHTGLRKDGVTPEFTHQLQIMQYVRTLLAHLDYPEETLAAVALHDTAEDADVGHVEIRERFGTRVGKAVERLTKTHRGKKVPTATYYGDMVSDEIASLVKGADRIHNLGSMQGVFTAEKQRAYISETEEFVLPMLKNARRTFPRQEPAYENEKFVLKSQIRLIEATLEATRNT